MSDPVVGGTALIRESIHSPDYVPGSTGWTINQDGTAEFRGLTLSGTFTGTNYILNNSGAFFYSGAPAGGNLAVSIAPAAGVDGFGNAYPAGLGLFAAGILIGNWSTAGFQLLTPGTTGQVRVRPILSATSSPALEFQSQAMPAGALVGELIQTNGTIVAGQDAWQMIGPAAAAATDPHVSNTNLIASAGGASDGASLRLRFSGSAIGDYLIIDKTGGNLLGSLSSTQPLSSPATAEGWHALSLNAGFAALGSGFQTPRYQIENVNGKRCRLDGTLALTANKAQGATFATVPASYESAASKLFLTPNNLSGGAGQVESINVSNNGNLNLGHAGSTGNYLSLDGVTFPCD